MLYSVKLDAHAFSQDVSYGHCLAFCCQPNEKACSPLHHPAAFAQIFLTIIGTTDFTALCMCELFLNGIRAEMARFVEHG